MKKNYTLLLLGFFATLSAQVPNNGFESTISEGSHIADWGHFFAVPITIDLGTGQSTSDQVTYDTSGTLCSSTTNSHTGQRAMLIQNAFNVTKNKVVPGKGSLINSEQSPTASGWNLGLMIPENAVIDRLSFWYKFNRVGNAVAEGWLQLFAATGETVAEAKIVMTSSTSGYTYATAPLTVFSMEIPVIMTIDFAMTNSNMEATFGSSLTIDDVAINESQLGISELISKSFVVYPTAASDVVNIRKNSGVDGTYAASIINPEGKILLEKDLVFQNNSITSLDVSAFASGLYFLKIKSGDTVYTQKIVRK